MIRLELNRSLRRHPQRSKIACRVQVTRFLHRRWITRVASGGNSDESHKLADLHRSVWQHVVIFFDRLTQVFPLWVGLGAAAGVARPAMFLWFQAGWIPIALAMITLGMGLSLTLEDFVEAARNSRQVTIGAAAQYLIMPSLGFFISRFLALPEAYRVGICIVASCPGGAASNLVCFLGRANVALSVLMTLTTTCMSILVTPLLLKLLAGHIVPVNAVGLLLSLVQVVVAPLALGLILNRLFPETVEKLSKIFPFFSVVGVVLICSSIVASHASTILSTSAKLLIALLLLHGGGFFIGYWVGQILGLGKISARTISIEVGMQNSGLGAALATAHFVDPLTAVPCALSATLHSLMGSLLAGVWRWRDSTNK